MSSEFADLAEEYEAFVRDAQETLNQYRDFGGTLAKIDESEGPLRELVESTKSSLASKTSALLAARAATGDDRARPSETSINALKESVERSCELALKAWTRARKRAESSQGDEEYEREMEAKRAEREERRRRREEEKLREEAAAKRKSSAMQEALSAADHFVSTAGSEETERLRRAREEAELHAAEKRKIRAIKGASVDFSEALIDQSGIPARDQVSVDVEHIMEARRKAQIEAQEEVRREKEKRIAEERRIKAENEAIDLNLPRLFIVKGVGDRVRAVPVPPRASSLTTTDHFILETETHLFHYKGKDSPIKRLKHAIRELGTLRKERLSKLKVVSMKHDAKKPAFWEALGGKRLVDQPGMSDEEWEKKQETFARLYRFDKDVGLMPEAELSASLLSSDSCFVLLTGAEFYMWFGRNTGLNLRKLTEQKAMDDFAYEVPKWVHLMTYTEGEESHLFRTKFADWDDVFKSNEGQEDDATLAAKRKKVTEATLQKMHDFNPDMVPIIDDTSGTVEVWLVNDYTKTPVPSTRVGMFFSGSSYICLYTSSKGGVLYFWQGSESSTLWSHARESIASVQHRVSMANQDLLAPGTPKMNKRGSTSFNTALAVQASTGKAAPPLPVMRLMEGDEPPHFLGVFRGRMLVRKGQADSFDATVNVLSMFHARGSNMFNSRCVQCSPSPKLLNSDDCFIVQSLKKLFLWKGEHCPTFVYEAAQDQVKLLDPHHKCVIVHESLEPPRFWKELGGKQDYFTHREVKEGRMRPRIFLYDPKTGNVTPKGSVLYSHLRPHQSAILDVFDEVYVWHGVNTDKKDHFYALEAGKRFVEVATDGRDKLTSVTEVQQGQEPEEFVRCFLGWMYLNSSNETATEKVGEIQQLTQQYRKTFTLQQLQNRDSLPLTLNRKVLEEYLSDEDFAKVFGMPLSVWRAQPAWKRTADKKKHGLF